MSMWYCQPAGEVWELCVVIHVHPASAVWELWEVTHVSLHVQSGNWAVTHVSLQVQFRNSVK